MISSNFCGILFWFSNYENTLLDENREKAVQSGMGYSLLVLLSRESDALRTIGPLADCNGPQLPCRRFCLQLKAVG